MGARLAIIDVAHGNAAVVSKGPWAAVIDAGRGNALLSFLAQEGITRLDEILISHSDADHIGGLIALLASDDFTFGRIRVNADATQDSQTWKDLTIAVEDARQKGKIDFGVGLTPSDTGQFDYEDVHLEVLGPSPFLAMRGVGGEDRHHRRITGNSLSAVIRVTIGQEKLALLTGDLDEIGLDELLSAPGVDLSAGILVFPHHGGRSGLGDQQAFARQICGSVRPRNIVFSIGRGKYDTPSPDVVDAVMEASGQVRIACTQLSKHCAASECSEEQRHLHPSFAQGRERRRCCGGTLVIEFDSLSEMLPTTASHQEFIQMHAPTAVCRRNVVVD